MNFRNGFLFINNMTGGVMFKCKVLSILYLFCLDEMPEIYSNLNKVFDLNLKFKHKSPLKLLGE